MTKTRRWRLARIRAADAERVTCRTWRKLGTGMDESIVVINHRTAVDFFPVEKTAYEHSYSNKRNLTETPHSVHVMAPEYLLHDRLSRCHVTLLKGAQTTLLFTGAPVTGNCVHHPALEQPALLYIRSISREPLCFSNPAKP